jgi:VanZ family protein
VKRLALAYLPLAVWAAAVLVVGGLERVPVPELPAHADKLGHFIMYGVGGALAAWAGRIRGWRAGLVALVLVILTGALDELRQAAMETRHGDIWDWVADTTGAIIFYLITARVLRKE